MKSLFEIQTESGQLWLDISAQLDALRKEGADALAAAQATAKEAADKASAELADAKAASDQAIASLAAMEARSKALASSARTEFAALATAMQNLKAISEEANKGFDEAEAAAKAKAIADAEAVVAKLKA